MKDIKERLGEAAKYFNDALLDEQAKLLKERGKEISRLNGIIHNKNVELDEKRKGCIKVFNENRDLKAQLESLRKNCTKEDVAAKDELIAKLRMYLKEDDELKTIFTDATLAWWDDKEKLEKTISDKDAVLSDVAEELRLSKIREENLTEVCQKYLKEIEELREKLANIVVNNVDAQALKSAESALAYKERVIGRLKHKIALLKKEEQHCNHSRPQ